MAKRYLNNKDLYNEVVVSLKNDELTDEAEKMFILLVDRISRKFYYASDADKWDCYQTAILHIFSNWRNFNPDKGTNAFAYFTEIVKRGFATGWGQITKQKGNYGTYIKHFSIDTNMDGGNMNF